MYKAGFCFVIILLIFASFGYGETIHMKDGRVINGTIIKKEHNRVTIKNKHGEFALQESNIEKVVYDAALGQIKLRLKDDTVVTGTLLSITPQNITIRDKNNELQVLKNSDIDNILVNENGRFEQTNRFPLQFDKASYAFQIGLSAGYFMATDLMGSIVKDGYGSMITVQYADVFYNTFLYLECGFSYFKAKVNNDDYMTIIPLLFGIGYGVNYKNFSVDPLVAIGAASINLFHKDGYGFLKEDNSSATYYSMLIKEGLYIGYTLGGFKIKAGLFFNHIIEKKSSVDFLSYYIGLHYLL